MYKFSRYNFKLTKNNKNYIYNARTGGFLELENKYDDFYNKYDFSNDDIESNVLLEDPELKENLEHGGFIVDSDLDEIKLIKAIHKLSSENDCLSLTILPTLECNFRCPYCFEKWNNYPSGDMSIDVQDKILDLIKTKVPEKGNLNICWYGGEPLLKMSIIKRLQGKINTFCEEKDINLVSSIITNGYLLTEKVCKELCDLNICFSQITLDGSESIHNKTRFLKNGNGSFQTIIKNLKNLDTRMNVSIRVNISKQNINDNTSFIKELKNSNITNNENIVFYYALVRDSFKRDCLNEDELFDVCTFSKKETDLLREAIKNGINVHPNISPKISPCGAVSSKSFVIEPNGDIQKCYEFVGDKNKSVGSILEQDYMLYGNSYKNNIDWYSWTPYDSEECISCKVLPLCFGGCPMYSIDKKSDRFDYRCLNIKYNLIDMLYLTLDLREMVNDEN